MKTILDKKTKKYFAKYFKKIKFYLFYVTHHPLAIIKAFVVLRLEGVDSFSRKLLRAEKRQSQYLRKRRKLSQYFKLDFWIRKLSLLFSYVTNILISLIFPPLYFISTFLFFTISQLISLAFSLTRRKMQIHKGKLLLNGISFVIPTWNKKDMVVECVKHLDKISASENPTLRKEIIVIDNGSIDQTSEALLGLKTKTPLRVIRSSTNLGFARGINLGASKAKYNYLYLMNNDMIPKPKFISEIVKFANQLLKGNRPFFGISSQIFFYDSTKRREE